MINILHLCNSREKACSNCGWKHQCKHYYAFPVLSHIGGWHCSVSLTVSGKAGLLSIGSPASCDPIACTHVNHRRNCCVKSCLHPLVRLQCASSPPKEIGHLQTTFALPTIHPGNIASHEPQDSYSSCFAFMCQSAWALLPPRHIACTFTCLASLCMCATSLPGIPRWTFSLSSSRFPKSDKELSSAFQSLCLDNLCGEDTTKSELEG